ncbi:MAG: DsbA family oxidoreductase [Nitriliruptoraceae bacterium]|nr:DsbA family oxidoreductase [Nitriliruptoraceae bacterium]
MQVEIWSDVACPWCAVGKRRFEAALRTFEHADDVALRWRSFELDPSAPRGHDGEGDVDYVGRLSAKYGTDRASAQGMIDRMTATAAEDGWRFRFDRIRPGNTFDAHRLVHLAADRDRQDQVKERFLAGYLEEGAPIGEPATLQALAVEAGLDDAEVADVLASDRYAEAVRADERRARELGISGVPFFVIDRRYGVSGAQPAAALVQALEQAWADRSTLTVVGAPPPGHDHGAGDACADGSCAV